MCNWGFAIAAVMKQTARGHFTNVVTYVDILIRTMCNWGFDKIGTTACGTLVSLHMLKPTSGPCATGVSLMLMSGNVLMWVQNKHEYMRDAAFILISLHVLKPTSGPCAHGVSLS